MSPLLKHAEEILETALAGNQEFGIVVGRQGSLRIIDPSGWTLEAMRLEFSARAVYRVEHRGSTVRVEGWDGDCNCRIEKHLDGSRARKPFLGLLPAPAGAFT